MIKLKDNVTDEQLKKYNLVNKNKFVLGDKGNIKNMVGFDYTDNKLLLWTTLDFFDDGLIETLYQMIVDGLLENTEEI